MSAKSTMLARVSLAEVPEFIAGCATGMARVRRPYNRVGVHSPHACQRMMNATPFAFFVTAFVVTSSFQSFRARRYATCR